MSDPALRHRAATIVGGGPAGLMAAEKLARVGVSVTVRDRMPSVGRKFLLAGRGGLNLTHSEPADAFLARYGAAREPLAPALEAFSPAELVEWCHALGVETFVGSSGRVFPKALKASPLLRAWIARLGDLGVRFALRSRWTGFDADGALVFAASDGPEKVRPDVAVLALGGASWPRLGSDGGWTAPLEAAGVAISGLRPANCGFAVPWSPHVAKFAGEPIKRAALSFKGATARGEAVVTARGVEGGLVYALSGPLREAIARDGEARPTLDLRPDLSVEALASKLATRPGGRSLSTHLRKAAGLAPVAVALLREPGQLPDDPAGLARRIKATPLRLVSPAPIARAISTAGGVRFEDLDERFMLRRIPGLFVAGEMLDWEAPTGGYLLQACFATGAAAGNGAIEWLRGRG